MILDYLNNMIGHLEEELRCSYNQRIRLALNEFDQCFSQQQRRVIIPKVIETALTKTFASGVWNQLYFEDKIIEQIDYLLVHSDETQQAITIKVSFQNHPQQLYRIMKLPYMIKLDDFCYSILAGLNIKDCKQFSLEINKINRYGCGQEIGDKEMDQLLDAYHIKKDTQMKLYYDFDQTYIFDIEVLNIEIDSTDTKIMEGKGYGIWENGAPYLNLYYQDKYQFLKEINCMGLDFDDFFTEEFNFIESNNHLLDDIELLKMKYSIKYEERKLFYEYLPFSFFIKVIVEKYHTKIVYFYIKRVYDCIC